MIYNRRIELKHAFKFHCDSINIIPVSIALFKFIKFKFHCDSINISNAKSLFLSPLKFKFHCDSINMSKLSPTNSMHLYLNSTVILLILRLATRNWWETAFKFHCDSINMAYWSSTFWNEIAYLNSTVILLIFLKVFSYDLDHVI